MTQFHKQSFSSRFGEMGDTAEGVFDLVYPKHHKLGLNRPPFGMKNMPLAMRYTPDRMQSSRFVEVMGIGRDRLLKMKLEKFDALFQWEFLGPVHLFVYDQTDGTYYEAPLRQWWNQAVRYGANGEFENDGKKYVALDVQHFPCEPKEAPQ